MKLQAYLFLSLLSSCTASPKQLRCRCLPSDRCWPSDRDWRALNSSINGNLVAVKPVAHVCHDPRFNEAACTAVATSWTNSTWRATQPGAVQWSNWEAWPQKDEYCYLDTSKNTPCKQGKVSLYSAVARSASDIQKAIQFAKRKNIRLAIKNSGHDFLGRSTAPSSLQILTFWLKSIEYTDKFRQKGDKVKKDRGPAVTIGAGVNLQELYAWTQAKGVNVVAGTSHTVGAAGGYIQGGGHSLLGNWKGLASDNALEFTVVTADGDLVTANDHQNQDLFWALRGGGGGTFGVVVSVTLRVFPEVPVAVLYGNISSLAGDPAFWDAMTEFHAILPTVSEAGGTSYYFVTPNQLVGNYSISILNAPFFFVNRSDVAEIEAKFKPFYDKVNQIPGVAAGYTVVQAPTVAAVFDILIPDGDDVTGGITSLGSRLISRKFFESKTGPRRLSDAMASLKMGPGDTFTGHIVAGGAGATNGKTVDSALNPAWRKTLVHLTMGRNWPSNATFSEQQAIQRNITEVEVPILKALEGGDNMGAYLNEADANEADFQEAFWGKNYNKLYRIKQKRDPSGLFITRRGVGSEDWDEAGLCKIRDARDL